MSSVTITVSCPKDWSIYEGEEEAQDPGSIQLEPPVTYKRSVTEKNAINMNWRHWLTEQKLLIAFFSVALRLRVQVESCLTSSSGSKIISSMRSEIDNKTSVAILLLKILKSLTYCHFKNACHVNVWQPLSTRRVLFPSFSVFFPANFSFFSCQWIKVWNLLLLLWGKSVLLKLRISPRICKIYLSPFLLIALLSKFSPPCFTVPTVY